MHNLGESKDQTKPKKSTKSKKIIIGGIFSFLYFFFCFCMLLITMQRYQ